MKSIPIRKPPKDWGCQARESRVECLDGMTDATNVKVDDQIQEVMSSMLDKLKEEDSDEEIHQGLECKSRESWVECVDSVTDAACVHVDSQVQEIMCSILDQLSRKGRRKYQRTIKWTCRWFFCIVGCAS